MLTKTFIFAYTDTPHTPSTTLSTLPPASQLSDCQIEEINEHLYQQQEARKQEADNEMRDNREKQVGSRKNEDNNQA